VRPRLKRLEHQTLAITGASSGIGLASAQLAATSGARVVLAARSADSICEAADAIRAQGGETAAVIADVANERQVRRIAEVALGRSGGFDTWVNNAGVSVYGTIAEVLLQEQRQVFETTSGATAAVSCSSICATAAERSSTSAACCPSGHSRCRVHNPPPSTRSRAWPAISGRAASPPT
jgi:short-subunit dehydrogenase